LNPRRRLGTLDGYFYLLLLRPSYVHKILPKHQPIVSDLAIVIWIFKDQSTGLRPPIQWFGQPISNQAQIAQ